MFKKLFGAALVVLSVVGLHAKASVVDTLIVDLSGDVVTADLNDYVVGDGEVFYDVDFVPEGVENVSGTFQVLFQVTTAGFSGRGDGLTINVYESVNGVFQNIGTAFGEWQQFFAGLQADAMVTFSISNTSNDYRVGFSSTRDGDAVVGVNAVPLPAAAWLFLSVLAGAGFMRRKGVAKA